MFGLEADLQGGDISDSVDLDVNIPPALGLGNTQDGRVAANVNYFGTVRGRLGLALGRIMPYVTGGFAWADVDVDMSLSAANPALFAESRKDSATHTGWVIGGGVEIALDQNWSIKGEYLYYDLGKEEYSFTYQDPVTPTLNHTFSGDMDLTFQTVRVGFNYKFGN